MHSVRVPAVSGEEFHAIDAPGGSIRPERRTLNLSGFAVREDRSVVPVTLINLSYEGCGIECPAELRAGETLQLSIIDKGVLKAEVIWSSNGLAGLIFKPVAQAKADLSRRRSERISVTADVSFKRPGWYTFSVEVSDFSARGCKLEFVQRPEVGERVAIKFRGLEWMSATVQWVSRSHLGLEFSNPIHPAVFQLLIRRLVA